MEPRSEVQVRQRFMRVILFFDLPVESADDRRDYSRFRNYLLNEGFVRVQKSVYSKVVLNGAASKSVVTSLRKHPPSNGVVQILVITEKQFQNIEYLVGESQKEVIDSLDRFVII